MPLLDVLFASMPGRHATARDSSTIPPPSLANEPTDDVDHLDLMPEDVVVLMCLGLTASQVVKLSASSKYMRKNLKLVRERIESARMRFLDGASITSSGVSVSARGARLTAISGKKWKAARCGPLARSGKSSWIVLLDECRGGYVDVGVATPDDVFFSWSLAAYSGHAMRMGPWIDGCLHNRGPAATEDEDGQQLAPRTPGEAYEGIAETSALRDAHGQTATLRRGAAGSQVEVTVDHDAGVLSFRVQTGSRSRSGDALEPGDLSISMHGFPAGAALCPFVALYDKGDTVVVQDRHSWSLE